MRVATRQTRRSGVRLLAVGAALTLVLAACGGDDDDDDAAGTTTTTAAASESTTTTSGGAIDQAATVAIAQTGLGDTLVDESGKTLYLFENDTAADASTCSGQCASTWPPLTVTGEIVLGDGLDDSMFSTFARDDGAMQVSVNGHPLYTFGPDTSPGDTNGQGVGGVWFAVGANGEKIEATGDAEGASSTSSSRDSGY